MEAEAHIVMSYNYPEDHYFDKFLNALVTEFMYYQDIDFYMVTNDTLSDEKHYLIFPLEHRLDPELQVAFGDVIDRCVNEESLEVVYYCEGDTVKSIWHLINAED